MWRPASTPSSTASSFAASRRTRYFLRDRAREIAARLGWTTPPVDSASTFERDYPFLSWMARTAPPGWARRLSSCWWTPTVFLFRQSPQPLVPRDFRGVVRPEDPPMNVPGMLSLDLDGRGRLRRLLAVPHQVRGVVPPSPPAAWGPLFAEAGFEEKDFVPSEPPWFPPVPYDALAGWSGTVPGMPGATLAVVAASRAGRPVYFELVAPWSEVGRMPTRPDSIRGTVTDSVQLAMSVGFTLAGVFFARRNLRLGRGDRTGAFRLATAVFLLALVSHLLGRHVSASPGVLGRAFWESLGDALPPALIVAVVYLLLFASVARRENPLFEMTGGALIATVFLAVFLRGGLLGLAVAIGVFNLLGRALITPDVTQWFAGYGLSCLAVVLAVAIYGFWAARGGVVLPGTVDG